jgi:serine/threonine protein kinase
MGEVYEARDLRLQSTVALKTVRSARVSDGALLDRLTREVTLARSISHPNVCRVYDLHEALRADGTRLHFLTMEFLDGETLAHRLQRGLFSPGDALLLLRQIAAGLEAIHAQGIIHRDVKPGNVLLLPEGSGIRAVVTDLGIARPTLARSSDAGWDNSESAPAPVSPVFSAPEQRSPGEITPRADVYAIGLVACAMVRSGSPGPSSFDGLPSRWARVLRKAMDPDPRRRFASPGRMVEALRRPVQRIWWMTGAAILAVLVVAGGLFLAERRGAASRDVEQLGQSAESPAAEHFARGMFRAARWQMIVENRAAMEEFEAAVSADPNYAPAHAQLGLAYARHLMLGATNDKSFIDKALREANRALELDPRQGAAHVVKSEIAFSRYGGWDFDAAVAAAQRATELEPKVGHQQLARLFAVMGLEIPAIRHAELAVTMESTPGNQFSLLFALNYTGNWKEALDQGRLFKSPNYLSGPLYQARLRTGDLAELADVMDHAQPRGEWGIALALQGKTQEALEAGERAFREANPERRPFYIDLYDRACLSAVLGRGDEAMGFLRRATDNGLPNYLLLSRDPLLAQLRGHPDFVQLVGELKPRWERWREKYP